MEKRTDTYSLAYECCDAVFFEEGRFPTIDAIRDRIHVNSPAVIKRAMNDWTLHFVEKHRRKLENPNMPAVIVDAAESLWKLALNQAESEYEVRNREIALRESEWKSQILSMENDLKEKETNWHDGRERMNNEILVKSESIKEFAGKLDVTANQLREAETLLSTAQQSLSRVEGALAESRSAQEIQAKEWSAKLEREHDWHLKRIEEEKDAVRDHYSKTITKLNQSLEIGKMDQESLRARLTRIMNQVGDSLERQTKLELEIEKLRDELAIKDKALEIEREKSGKLHAMVKRQRRPSENKSSVGVGR